MRIICSRTIIATPPGWTIREQLEMRKMTQKEFARRMDMSEKHISQLINGEVRLMPEIANRLETILGVPASFWNNLEAYYQERVIQANEENNMDRGLSRDYIIHPGATLAEVIEDRNISTKELASKTCVTEKYISAILNGKKSISATFAKKLERTLGIEASFWLKLQANYDKELLEFEDKSQ